MCGAAAIPALIGTALLGTTALQAIRPPDVSTPQINTYTPQEAPAAAQGPEAPQAAPIMTTQGQGEAEDEQKATEQRVRKNRQGRNILRIDRTVPNTSGLAGGSGVNVPGG